MTSFLKQFVGIALRFLCLSVGAWMTAIVPVAIMASNVQVSNAATGYPPNMDPGVMVFFAAIFTVPVVATVVVIELFRCWAFEKKPLTLPTYTVLGALAASPIGFAFTRNVSELAGMPAIFVATLAIMAWTILRRARQANR